MRFTSTARLDVDFDTLTSFGGRLVTGAGNAITHDFYIWIASLFTTKNTQAWIISDVYSYVPL